MWQITDVTAYMKYQPPTISFQFINNLLVYEICWNIVTEVGIL